MKIVNSIDVIIGKKIPIRINGCDFELPISDVVYKFASVNTSGVMWLYTTKPEFLDDFGWAGDGLSELHYIGEVSEFGDASQALFDIEYI